MVRRVASLPLLFVLGLCGSAQAQDGTIAGRVTAADTGAPLSSVFVYAVDTIGHSTSIQTDSSGAYSISLGSGSYAVYTHNIQSYVDQLSGGGACTVPACDWSRATAIQVRAGATTLLDFALARGGLIAGRVVDAATRSALPNHRAEIEVFTTAGLRVGDTTSDENGFYTATWGPGLPTGLYHVVARAIGSGWIGEVYGDVACTPVCSLADGVPVRVDAGATTGGIDFALGRTGTITGRVTSVSGSPIVSALVYAKAVGADRSRDHEVSAALDVNGYFTLSNLYARPYFVYADAAVGPDQYVGQIFPNIACAGDCALNLSTGTPLTVGPGATLAGIDFTLEPGGSISGRVTSPTNALTPSVGAGSVRVFNAAGILAREAPADAAGQYRISGLPAGTYFVSATRSIPLTEGWSYGGVSEMQLYSGVSCPSLLCNPTMGTPVAVGASGVVTGIDFAFAPLTASVSGTVRVDGTGVATAVELYSQGHAVALTTSDGSGQYSFSGLPPGTYEIHVPASSTRTGMWFSNVCEFCAHHTAIDVGAGEAVSAIDFSSSSGGTIAGSVTQSASNFDPVQIEILRPDHSVVAMTLVVSAAYSIAGVAPGTYYVRATDPVQFHPRYGPFAGRLADVLYPGVPCDGADCPLTGATPLTVTAGATIAGVDFTMREGAVISGYFRSENGDVPDPGGNGDFVELEAYSSDGRRVGKLYNYYGTAGHPYSVVGLAGGTYYLRAVTGASSGYPRYANMLYRDLACASCSPLDGAPIIVAAGGQRDGIDFVLRDGLTISGNVHAGSTPLENVTVNVTTLDGRPARTTTTDRLGNYVATGLAPGFYAVTTSNAIGYVDQIYGGFGTVPCTGCDATSGVAVKVDGQGVSSGRDFDLSPGRRVTGTVRSAPSTSALGQAHVSFFDATSAALLGRVAVDSAGTYAFTGDSAPLKARATATGFAAQLYDNVACPFGDCDPASGTSIDATVARVDFVLSACPALSLSPTQLPPATANETYTETLSATGGTGPYHYSVVSGTFPPGLVLDSTTGQFSRAATHTGRYPLAVAASDAYGCTVTREYALDVRVCTVQPASTSFDLTAAETTLTLAVAGGPCAFEVMSAASWIQVLGAGGGQVRLAISANTGGSVPRLGRVTVGDKTVTIRQAAPASALPFGAVDLPIEGAVVSGSIALGGWALDDLRVNSVRIFRDPVTGEGSAPIFVGDAVFVRGARPDVEALFATYAYADRGGWGFLLLTNTLPNQGNGTFRLHAFATDVEGHEVAIGSRTIVADNEHSALPFGAIDTPGQGETIAGASYVNFGWALTPPPALIPRDGSTIQVLIDGASIGNPSYSNFRSDIATLFPQYTNADAAVGYRYLDTTTLRDGMHTISWTLTDSAGASAEIGSRYFTVANTPGSTALTLAGQEADAQRHAVAATDRADAHVVVTQMETIEVDLNALLPGCAGAPDGHERIGMALRSLPVGSSIDAERGTFTWQPGPAFVGTYFIVLTREGCPSREAVVEIEIRANK